MASKTIFLCPKKGYIGDINRCIDYVVKEIYKCSYVQEKDSGVTQEIIKKVEYFNSTIPNKLFLIIKENNFTDEDKLMKNINYTNIENLGELIACIQAINSQTGPIIIEKLSFIIKNTRMEYQEINRLIVKLFRLLKNFKGTNYLIEPHENFFMSNNCDSDIEV